jgi:acyl transferase domain-containing protein
VKSNLGHLEGAAGLAGLFKLLLQLRHGVVAPSLHSRTLNPHLDLAATPFHIPQAPLPWPRGATPRRAGLSSFGAGGANAHVVVEEGPPAPADAGPDGQRHLFILSARESSRLRATVAAWREWLRRPAELSRPPLADAAFTLQVGREPGDERLAFTAADWGEVATALDAFAAGEPRGDLVAGSARAERLGRGLAGGPEGAEFVRGLVRSGRWDAVARWWVEGAEVDWREAWAGRKPRRVSLPGTIFARDRHWVTPLAPAAARPLRLAAEEPVLRDHEVQGRRILPGAASLALARVELARVLGGEAVALRDITWLAPLRPDPAGLELLPQVSREGEGAARLRFPAPGGGEAMSVATGLRSPACARPPSTLTRCAAARPAGSIRRHCTRG